MNSATMQAALDLIGDDIMHYNAVATPPRCPEDLDEFHFYIWKHLHRRYGM